MVFLMSHYVLNRAERYPSNTLHSSEAFTIVYAEDTGLPQPTWYLRKSTASVHGLRPAVAMPLFAVMMFLTPLVLRAAPREPRNIVIITPACLQNWPLGVVLEPRDGTAEGKHHRGFRDLNLE